MKMKDEPSPGGEAAEPIVLFLVKMPE